MFYLYLWASHTWGQAKVVIKAWKNYGGEAISNKYVLRFFTKGVYSFRRLSCNSSDLFTLRMVKNCPLL